MGKHAMDQNVRPRRRDLRRIHELSEQAQLRKQESAALEEKPLNEESQLDALQHQLKDKRELTGDTQICETAEPSADSVVASALTQADSLSDTGETSVIDITQLAEVELPQEKIKYPSAARFPRMVGLADKCLDTVRSGLHCSNSKRALAGIGVGAAVVGLIIGSIGVNQATQAQAVAHQSILKSNVMDSSAADTPDTLSNDQKAQAKAKAGEQAETAQNIVSDTEALCEGLGRGANSVVSAYVSEDLSPVYYPMKRGTYRISSSFGMRTHPITGAFSMHNGVDMSGSSGTPIYSVADGVVLSVNEAGSNNGIVIEHHVNGTTFTSWYLHSYSSDILVSPGEEVKAGQKIALRGSAGMSTGPHLHFEMHWGAGTNTRAVEPFGALEELGAMDLSQECKMR